MKSAQLLNAVALHFQDVTVFSVAEVQQIEHTDLLLNIITQHIITVINTYISGQLSSP